MGGMVPFGYQAKDRQLIIDKYEAKTIQCLFDLYERFGTVRLVKQEADRLSLKTPIRKAASGRITGGRPLSPGHIYKILGNPLYVGSIAHKKETHPGQHQAIIAKEQWNRVRDRLNAHTAKRQFTANATEPSLLAGLLYTDDNIRFVADHASKKGKRYRY